MNTKLNAAQELIDALPVKENKMTKSSPIKEAIAHAGEGQEYAGMDYHALNAMLNLYDENGHIQFDADKAAARQYFLQHVNQNTVFFHNLEEKLGHLVMQGYYESQVLEQYDFAFIKDLYDFA